MWVVFFRVTKFRGIIYYPFFYEKPDTLPPLSESDWLVVSHFQIPQNDPHWHVCGGSDWTGDPRSGLKRRYVIIDPQEPISERKVTLGIVPL